MLQLNRGDLILSRSNTLMGKVARFFSRHIGESRTQVNHSMVVIKGGSVQQAVIVEALYKVVCRKLIDGYNSDGIQIAVFRKRNISDESIGAICEKAMSYNNRRYGIAKLFAHFGDWLLQGAYIFRRLARNDYYPICSWLSGFSYAAGNVFFGKPPAQLQPDDMWDYVKSNSEEWECIYPLSRLSL